MTLYTNLKNFIEVKMNFKEIVDKKFANKELSFEEIKFCVDCYMRELVNDENMTNFLKAIYDNGMSNDETYFLTKVLQNSGVSLNLHSMGITNVIVDKHSTGGVSDSTTLIIVPLLASLGISVVKMSGGKLGFTGGTADKIKCFANLKNEIPLDEAVEIVKNNNGVFLTQSEEFAPDDKKIYHLRDKTGLVDSVPLIASSVASKKLAVGADIILIDVKCGDGAMIKDLRNAKKLSNLLMWIFKKENKRCVTVISQMNRPLGDYIGNELEVYEAILILKNKLNNNLLKLSLFLCGLIVQKAFGVDNYEAYNLLSQSLKSKKALKKFMDIVQAQGGSLVLFQDRIPYKKHKIKSSKSGYLFVNTAKLGELCNYYDSVFKQFKGVHLLKPIFEFVEEGEDIFEIITRHKNLQVENNVLNVKDLTNEDLLKIKKQFQSCFQIRKKKPNKCFKLVENVVLR